VLSNGLDGIESALSHNGILLVCQLLLEHLDGPRGANVSAEIGSRKSGILRANATGSSHT
jgi:hypothetical protein